MIDSASNKPSKTSVLTLFVAVASMLVFTSGCGRALERAASGAAASAVDRIVTQPDSTVELLEAELRWMEDNLYRMDDQLDNALGQLQSARRNNAILRLELAEARRADSTYVPASSGGSSILRSNGAKSNGGNGAAKPKANGGDFDEETKELDDTDPYNLDISLGEPATKGPKLGGSQGPVLPDSSAIPARPTENLPTPAKPNTPPPGSGAVPNQSNGVPTPAPLPNGGGIRPELAPDPDAIQPQPLKPNPFLDDSNGAVDKPGDVTRIILNPRLTGGYNFDGQPGHEGIIVVIEPQNSYAQYVPTAGDVTIEVFDPTKSGLAGRVGKWKFDSVEANAMIKKSLMGKGVHLQLPWPAAPPQNRELTLAVSYELPNGRSLKAKKKLLVEPLTSSLVEKADAAEQESWSPYRPNGVPEQVGGQGSEPAEFSTRFPSGWQPNR